MVSRHQDDFQRGVTTGLTTTYENNTNIIHSIISLTEMTVGACQGFEEFTPSQGVHRCEWRGANKHPLNTRPEALVKTLKLLRNRASQPQKQIHHKAAQAGKKHKWTKGTLWGRVESKTWLNGD